jgi:hypothetical protein
MEGKRIGGQLLKDDDRDVSERIALGEAVPMSKDTMFDQRLFNQTGGMQHGHYQDEEYNIYEKPLFNAGSGAALYKVRWAEKFVPLCHWSDDASAYRRPRSILLATVKGLHLTWRS